MGFVRAKLAELLMSAPGCAIMSTSTGNTLASQNPELACIAVSCCAVSPRPHLGHARCGDQLWLHEVICKLEQLGSEDTIQRAVEKGEEDYK